MGTPTDRKSISVAVKMQHFASTEIVYAVVVNAATSQPALMTMQEDIQGK